MKPVYSKGLMDFDSYKCVRCKNVSKVSYSESGFCGHCERSSFEVLNE
jgi:hypothetical protein